MPAHKALIAEVLRSLGQPVPTDDELTGALKQAFVNLKKSEGLDPSKTKYKLSLTPVDESWVKETFDIAPK